MPQYIFPTYDQCLEPFHGNPKHFVKQLRANIDNDKLTNEEFRTFVRNALPVYEEE